MTKLQQLRWIEVQFFYILMSAKDRHNDTQDVLDLISGLAFLDHYTIAHLQYIAIEFLRESWTHPSRDEVVHLSKIAGVPKRKVDGVLHLCNQAYYDILERTYVSDHIMPRLDASWHKDIQRFLKVFDELRRFGI